MKPKLLALAILLSFSSDGFAYLEPSFRIKALGEDFSGIIVDEYTDIFRNPAYLTLVNNYKIFGEYRKDGGSRFILGTVGPKTGVGRIALIANGWEQKTEQAFQATESYHDYYYPYTVTTKNLGSSKLSNPNLKNLGLIYALNINSSFSLGANLIYFEDRFEWDSRNTIMRFVTHDSTQQLLRQEFSDRQDMALEVPRFTQFQAGVSFFSLPTLSFDLVFTFQHRHYTNKERREDFYQVDFYDSLGNLTASQKSIATEEILIPEQKGNTIGLGFRLSKKMAVFERLNFLGSFAYTDWDTKTEFTETRSVEYWPSGNTSSSSEQQLFNGTKENFDIILKFALESKDINKFKLYAGIAGFVGLEKQNYPDFLPSVPTSKWRNNFYKISFPLALEFVPLKNGTLRYGILPSYIYNRIEGFARYYYDPRWTSSTKTNMKFDDTFGFGYQFLNRVTVEGYLLQFGNLFTVDHWMIGATYSF